MSLCVGTLQVNGQRIDFEGGPALRFIIRKRRRRNGHVHTQEISFEIPTLSLQAALWAQRNFPPEFKYISISPA